MPLGAGPFTLQNKILPGAYTNITAKANVVTSGARGIAALPLSLSWGVDGSIFRIDAADFYSTALETFGFYANADELLLVRECMKRAKTLLCYKVNQGGEKAAAAVGGLTATAKYTGTRGNDLTVAVVENPNGGWDVVTYLDLEEIERQNVATADDVQNNAFIDFTKTGDLTAVVGTSLAGGTDGTVTGANYTKFLSLLEAESFHAVGYPGDDAETRALFVAYIKRLHDEEGYLNIKGVVTGSAADSIAIINVKNGVVLESGKTLTPAETIAWVTGATAAAEVNESLTQTQYDGAVDVSPKYTKGQYEAAIKAGEFCFYAEGGKALVLSDINSLTTFTTSINSDFTGNRLVRTVEGFAADVANLFGASYLGKVTNSEIGRELFKADIVTLAGQYESIDAISDFHAYDVEVKHGNGKRDVYCVGAIKANDSMEKLYFNLHIV